MIYPNSLPSVAALSGMLQLLDRSKLKGNTAPFSIGGRTVSKIKVDGLMTGKPRLVAYAAGTIRKPAALVGRNELCPCGSKKKFKKCCGRPEKPHAAPRLRPKLYDHEGQEIRVPEDASETDELVTQDEVSTGEVKYDIFTQLHQMIVAECPEGVYAYLETGLVIPDASRQNYGSDKLIRYDGALQRWYAMPIEVREQQLANWARYCAEPATFADRDKPQESNGNEVSTRE